MATGLRLRRCWRVDPVGSPLMSVIAHAAGQNWLVDNGGRVLPGEIYRSRIRLCGTHRWLEAALEERQVLVFSRPAHLPLARRPALVVVLAMIVGAIVLVLKKTWPGEDGDDR